MLKRPYLNQPFFFIRWVIYFVSWIGLSLYFWRRSLDQDATGNDTITLRLQKLSAPAIIIFAITLTFAAFDLLMSLDPHWFSTIYGVYYFSGSFVGFLAVLILALMAFQNQGLLTRSITVEHYHDLGKLLFGFVFFWGYIAFSQYMLIWYGNIPEETGWLFRRARRSRRSERLVDGAGHPALRSLHHPLRGTDVAARQAQPERAGLLGDLDAGHALDRYGLAGDAGNDHGIPADRHSRAGVPGGHGRTVCGRLLRGRGRSEPDTGP